VLVGADVFVGVSRPNLISSNEVRTMNQDPIIFALSNPEPEIMPEEAYAGGAAIVATGRSDFPNQVNNVLAFPGLFKGILEARIPQIEHKHLIAVAKALADYVKTPTKDVPIIIALCIAFASLKAIHLIVVAGSPKIPIPTRIQKDIINGLAIFPPESGFKRLGSISLIFIIIFSIPFPCFSITKKRTIVAANITTA